MPNAIFSSLLENVLRMDYLDTSSGKIAFVESVGKGPVIIMIHGNSSVKEVFTKQFSELGCKYHLIAIDLPGHGMSDDAKEPKSTYSFPGYAEIILEAIEKKGITQATILGWSLGGHVALEVAHKSPALIKRLILTGTPPIELTEKGIKEGFHPFEGAEMMGQKNFFSYEEAVKFISMAGILAEDKELKAANPTFELQVRSAQRTDGNARAYMFNSIAEGVGEDERKIVKELKAPIIFIMGKYDRGINNNYITTLVNEIQHNGAREHKIEWAEIEAGHACFWENSRMFNSVIDKFMRGD